MMTGLAAKHFGYRLQFRRGSDGRTIPAGQIPTAFLEPSRQQTRWQAVREGLPSETLGTIPVIEEPIFAAANNGEISGVRMSVEHDGQRIERTYSLDDLFGAAAKTQMIPLAKKGGPLDTDGTVVFNVFAEPQPELPVIAASDGVVITIEQKPLPFQEAELGAWLKQAEPSGPVDDERDYPLFLRQKVVDRAREYCFKTGRKEGGAWVFGGMYRQCSPTPEVFGVAEGVVELRHASQNTFSFEPTAKTFADLNDQMELRRTRFGRSAEMGLVLVHNHPFEPSVRDDGEAECTTCPVRQTCQLTSSFYSTSDTAFHLSMFGSSQPWVTGMVIGMTPRREDDVRLFCLDGSRARERGYYKIP